MVATFWLTLCTPLATALGVTPESAGMLFGMFIAILIAAFATFRFGKQISVWALGAVLLLETLLGLIDWLIFGVIVVAIITIEMKIGHGS